MSFKEYLEENEQDYKYYKDQLNSLLPIQDNKILFQFVANNPEGTDIKKTKWMNLNVDSKKALIDFLNENIKD